MAELLIVVAIIAVLVAIAIPIFVSQLERSREAVDAANIRSQYSMVMAESISTDRSVDGQELYGPIQLKQQVDGWSSESAKNNLESVYGGHIIGTGPLAGGTAWVEFNADGGYPILHYGGTGSSGSSGGDDSTGDIPSGAPPIVNSPPVDWNNIQTDGNAFTVTPGEVYFWNGNYYIGTRNQTIDAWNIQNKNPETFTEWFVLAEYSNTIHDISEYPENTNTQQPTKRGDICKVGNDYYVFSDGGEASYGPIRDSNRWTKIN